MFNIEVKHESQGYFPICALISAVRMFEWHYEKLTGERKEFDIRVLYSEIQGNGDGVNTKKMLHHMMDIGLVELKDPFDPYDKPDDWVALWDAYAESRKDDERTLLEDYKQITTKVSTEAHREAIRESLKANGPHMVTVNAVGGWYKGDPDDGRKWTMTHKILLTGWDDEYWRCNNAWDNKYKYPQMDYEYPFAFPTYFTGIIQPNICNQ